MLHDVGFNALALPPTAPHTIAAFDTTQRVMVATTALVFNQSTGMVGIPVYLSKHMRSISYFDFDAT